MPKCPECGHEFQRDRGFKKGHNIRKHKRQTPEHIKKRVLARKRTMEMKKFVREN